MQKFLLISIDKACELAPNLQELACNVYVFQLSFYFCMPPLVVGWVGWNEALVICVEGEEGGGKGIISLPP